MNFNILNNLNFSSILQNINKTLNVVKKSIPVYREIRPYMNSKKSLFKTKDNSNILNKQTKQNNYNNNLTFFS